MSGTNTLTLEAVPWPHFLEATGPSWGDFTPPISLLCVQDAGGKEADIFVEAFVLEAVLSC